MPPPAVRESWFPYQSPQRSSYWIASFLYGIGAQAPLTYAAIVGLLALAGFAAAYVPSRRAARVDPMVVMRYD